MGDGKPRPGRAKRYPWNRSPPRWLSPRVLDDLREAGEHVSRKARGAADERAWSRRRNAETMASSFGCTQRQRKRPEQAGSSVQRVGAESRLGQRHHVHPHLGRLALARGGHRPLLASRGGLVDATEHAHRHRAGNADHGRRSTTARTWTAPAFRSRLAVHERRLPTSPEGPRHRVQPERSWQLLGQRVRRELLRNPEEGAHLPAELADPPRCGRTHPRVHRGLLQPSAPPHDQRRQVRACDQP
jgi:hypothetical protein